MNSIYQARLVFSDANLAIAGYNAEIVAFANTTYTFLTTLAQPALTITPAGTNVIISWPLSAADFKLQATVQTPPNDGWSLLSNLTTVIGQRIVLTNPIAAGVEFFRLQKFAQ